MAFSSISAANAASSTSSIYGNRNVITGLASGMDTESMIENAVSGIKMKIANLNKQSTKLTWKQDAYRSIIDKMVNFTQKYTSYASNTNLSSQSFFNSASKVTTGGENKDRISATGKTSSDIKILGVQKLATSATYRVSGLGGSSSENPSITAANAIDLNAKQRLSNVAGSMTIKYGGARSFDIDFGELDIYERTEDFAKAIEDKLGEINVTRSNGEVVKASDMVGVNVNDGKIEFSDKQGAGNKVSISSATGKLKETLGINPSDKPSVINTKDKALFSEDSTVGKYLSGKEISITLDGKQKTIKLPEYKDGETDSESFVNSIQEQLNKAFGDGKITASNAADAGSGELKLKLETAGGSTMSISSKVGKPLGFKSDKDATYVDNSKSLGDILDKGQWENYRKSAAVGDVREIAATSTRDAYNVDSKGHKVAKADDGEWYRIDDKGAFLYDFEMNGETVGQFSENTAMETVINTINNSSAGVNLSYSKTTNEFLFTAKDTGSAGKIEFGEGLAKDLFVGGEFKEGTDAVLSMEVNGKTYDGITRSSNSFEVDGLNITLKGTFGTYNDDGKIGDEDAINAAREKAVTFTSGTDTDKVVDTIKSFVEDYNAMVTEIKDAYTTMPAYKNKSSYTKYEPLTEEEAEGMTETAIKNYEEKAKQGILFGDRNLNALYNKLRSNISSNAIDGSNLNDIGLSTSYSNGITTLSLDESKLRAALESNPDRVKEAFTKTVDGGASSNGLMANLKTTLDTYAKTTGDKGILIREAGSPRAPASLNDNALQKQMDRLQTQIDKWTNKYSDKIDYYTSQFSKLEQLIAQMNSQSSALAGLMGGYGGSY